MPIIALLFHGYFLQINRNSELSKNSLSFSQKRISFWEISMKFLGDFWGFRFWGQNGKLEVKSCEKRTTKVVAKRGH